MDRLNERETRDRTRMFARVTCRQAEAKASVLDLNDGGMCVYLATDIGAEPGRQVSVFTEEMGVLDGTVRWARGPRIGIQLNLSSNNRARWNPSTNISPTRAFAPEPGVPEPGVIAAREALAYLRHATGLVMAGRKTSWLQEWPGRRRAGTGHAR